MNITSLGIDHVATPLDNTRMHMGLLPHPLLLVLCSPSVCMWAYCPTPMRVGLWACSPAQHTVRVHPPAVK